LCRIRSSRVFLPVVSSLIVIRSRPLPLPPFFQLLLRFQSLHFPPSRPTHRSFAAPQPFPQKPTTSCPPARIFRGLRRTSLEPSTLRISFFWTNDINMLPAHRRVRSWLLPSPSQRVSATRGCYWLLFFFGSRSVDAKRMSFPYHVFPQHG